MENSRQEEFSFSNMPCYEFSEAAVFLLLEEEDIQQERTEKKEEHKETMLVRCSAGKDA